MEEENGKEQTVLKEDFSSFLWTWKVISAWRLLAGVVFVSQDGSLLTRGGCECRMLSELQLVLFNNSPSPSITSEPSILPPWFMCDHCVSKAAWKWLKTVKIPNYCSWWKRKFLNSCSTKQPEYIYFLWSFQAHTQDILFTECLQDFRAIKEALSVPKPRLLCFVVAHGVKEVDLVVFFAGVF